MAANEPPRQAANEPVRDLRAEEPRESAPWVAPAIEAAPAPEPVRVAEQERHRAPEREAQVAIEAAAPVEASRAPYVPPAPRWETPRVDPKQELASAGLTMIETDPTKVRELPASPELEKAQLGRPRRERQPPPQPEQLVQIETRK